MYAYMYVTKILFKKEYMALKGNRRAGGLKREMGKKNDIIIISKRKNYIEKTAYVHANKTTY